MMIKSTSFKVLLALGALGASQLLIPSSACAGPACDPKILEAMNSKGWQEAQREVTINEAHIYKPDSVFALSCFGNAIGQTPNSFSSGSPQTNANSALSTYGGNFGHGYTGQTGSQALNGSTCDVMRRVWNNTRCFNVRNVSGNANTAFNAFNFTSLSNSTRNNYSAATAGSYPTDCSTTYPTTVYTSANTLLNMVGVGATYDNGNLYLAITDPLALLSGSTNCSPGILTGVEIGTGSTTYPEKVCPNPGCVPKWVSSPAPGTMKCCDQTNLSARCEP